MEIKFKKDNIITYTISDLKAFGINGESIYQRHTVKYHLLPNDESAQYAPNEELIDSASVWLKLLVSSKIYFEAPSLKRFFFTIQNVRTFFWDSLLMPIRVLQFQDAIIFPIQNYNTLYNPLYT